MITYTVTEVLLVVYLEREIDIRSSISLLRLQLGTCFFCPLVPFLGPDCSLLVVQHLSFHSQYRNVNASLSLSYYGK
jgi:hypothetical protein